MATITSSHLGKLLGRIKALLQHHYCLFISVLILEINFSRKRLESY